jgi:hypothetical protein
MTALNCPHCGVRSHFTHHYHLEARIGEYGSSLFTCDECGNPISALRQYDGEIKEYWPTKVSGKSFPDVPTPIAATANEAHLCLGAGSPRGAVALARAIVESVAKDKGIKAANLELKIVGLHQENYISDAMAEAAHEIRFAGNEVAHGDLVAEPLSIQDADEIISLMDTILERVYQEPAKVERIRAKREERKAKAKTGKELTGMDLIQRELGDQVIGEIGGEPSSGYSDEPPF